MTNNEFRCWMNGYFTLSDEDFLDDQQIHIIKNHANLVKQMAGFLDKDILNFIFQLESNMQQNFQIDLPTMRKIAENTLQNFTDEK